MPYIIYTVFNIKYNAMHKKANASVKYSIILLVYTMFLSHDSTKTNYNLREI